MILSKITQALDAKVSGSVEIEITAVSCDSRNIELDPRPFTGSLFVAIPGEHVDGHSFVPRAVSAGAIAVLAEKETPAIEATQVIVPDVREAISKASDIFYGQPSKSLVTIGVTGTNGKTTTTYILESILRKAGHNPGVIGTVNYRYNGKTLPAPHTTPQAPELHKILREMKDAGVTHCVMEVSSHALEQKRAADCRFRAGVFTNLTHDHLDYHKTMDEYFRCKSILFELLSSSGGASVINIDDPWGRKLSDRFKSSMTFSLKGGASIYPKSASLLEGRTEAVISTPGGDMAISTHLVGEYNLQNILGAIGVALSLGIGIEAIAKGIASLERVPGRLAMLFAIASMPMPRDNATPMAPRMFCRLYSPTRWVDIAMSPPGVEITASVRPSSKDALFGYIDAPPLRLKVIELLNLSESFLPQGSSMLMTDAPPDDESNSNRMDLHLKYSSIVL